MPIRPEFRHFYRGPAWQATRARIRERAGDRCEHCGAPNGAFGCRDRAGRFVVALEPGEKYFPPVWIQCGAAHLNQIAGDDRDENLAWLCRGCHLRHDAKIRAAHAHETRATRKDRRRPLFGEAQV